MTPATFSDRKLVAPTLPICRQFERGECDKAACKWAHVEMYDNVRRIRGEVQVCGDFLRNACNRIDCKFFHAPPEWNLHRSKKCVAVCEKFMNNECFLLQSECNAAHPEDSNVLTDVSVSVCVEYLIDPLRCSGTDCRCYHPPEDHVLFQQLRKQVLAQKARLEQKAEVLPQRGNVSLKILNNSTRPGNAGAARGGRGTARGGHQSSTAREGGAALPPGVSSGNLRSLSSIGAGGASRGRAQQRPPPKLQQIPSTVGNNPMATSIDFGDLGGSIDASELEFPLQTGDDFDLTGGDQDYDIIDPSGTEKQIHMDLDAGDEIDENGNLVCREVLGEDNLLLTSTDGPGRGSSVSGMDRGGDHGGRKARSLDRYGRERCSDFKLGRCNRGMNCKFSHDRGDDFEPPPGGVSNAGGGLFSSGVGGQSAIRGGAPQQNNSAFIPVAGGTILGGGPAQREICKDFQNGKCKRGANCKFSHDIGNIISSVAGVTNNYSGSFGGPSSTRSGSMRSAPRGGRGRGGRGDSRRRSRSRGRRGGRDRSRGRGDEMICPPSMELCADFRLRTCTRPGCRFLHLTQDEAERQGFIFDEKNRCVGQKVGREPSTKRDRRDDRRGGRTGGAQHNEKVLCGDFQLGKCFRADCKFVHEIRQADRANDLGNPRSRGADGSDSGGNLLVQPCLDFQNGKCNRGQRCKFAH